MSDTPQNQDEIQTLNEAEPSTEAGASTVTANDANGSKATKQQENQKFHHYTDTDYQHRLKTGIFERRWTLAKAGFLASTKLAASAARSCLKSPEQRQAQISQELTRQANYLVTEIGKLKGSIVKIGQLLALWGEHYLPSEVTTALHQLEDSSAPLEWSVIEACLRSALGPTRFAEFDFDPQPVGAASFGQVHRATRISDGQVVCFKIQYPGVSDSIEADLVILNRLLKVTRMVKFSRDFDQWMGEVKSLLRNEVDYDLELATTQRFFHYLHNDGHYRVPEVFPEYSSRTILCSTFEPGEGINTEAVKNLPQSRRDRIAANCIELFWREVFEWGEMQTDPNFGNYFVRIDPEGHNDLLILLDFGAVHRFDTKVLCCGHLLILGTYHNRPEWVTAAIKHLGFLHPNTPQRVFDDFFTLCRMALEPFLTETSPFHNEQGQYHWMKSNLINRLLAFASHNALSRAFSIPPKELMHISRKIMGAYTLMGLLNAQFNATDVLKPFVMNVEAETLINDLESSQCENHGK